MILCGEIHEARPALVKLKTALDMEQRPTSKGIPKEGTVTDPSDLL